MSDTVISFRTGKACTIAAEAPDFQLKILLEPVQGAEPMDVRLFQPLTKVVLHWMQTELEKSTMVTIVPSLVVDIWLRMLRRETVTGDIANLQRKLVRPLSAEPWPGEQHWFIDHAGRLCVGTWQGDVLTPAMTYHRILDDYYVHLPAWSGRMMVMRLVD